MEIQKILDGLKLTVKLIGKLNTITAVELQKELDLSDIKELVWDFKDLELLTSSGIRILLTSQQTMNSSGGSMKILFPQDIVYEVLELTGLDKLFDIEK